MGGSEVSGRRAAAEGRSLDDIAKALKERVYAAFTGLAVVMIYAVDEQADSAHALRSLVIAIIGISAAGFVADVIAHQVAHAATPTAAQARTMLRISGGALASASLPVLVLGASALGWIEDVAALQVSVAVYVVTLAGIALIAVVRAGLGVRHGLIALLGLVGLGAAVVGVLVLSH